MPHYFENPPSDHAVREFAIAIRGHEFRFITDRGVFSRERIDPGTLFLAKTMEIAPTDTVLDLGCGYGALGIVAAYLAPQGRVHLVDRNPRAVELAVHNLTLNRITNAEIHLGEGTAPVLGIAFDVAVMNPPIRAGRETVLTLMREAHAVLRPGGGLYFVARTKQGAQTLATRCAGVFGNCAEVAKQSGYRVYCATKKAGPA